MKCSIVLVAATCLISLSGAANATVSIAWKWNANANGAVYNNNDSGYLPSGNIVQLIFSSDQAVSSVSSSMPLAPTGGDVLLAQNVTTADGWWDYGSAVYDATDAQYGLAEDTFVGGYVYQRVFDDIALDGIDAGTDYYADSISEQIVGPLADQDPTPTTSDFSNLYTTGDFDGSNFDVVPVPEPASMGLFLLGGLAMIVRRRMRK